jgi:hypothetical protein
LTEQFLCGTITIIKSQIFKRFDVSRGDEKCCTTWRVGDELLVEADVDQFHIAFCYTAPISSSCDHACMISKTSKATLLTVQVADF